jgi:hypothetical protein
MDPQNDFTVQFWFRRNREPSDYLILTQSPEVLINIPEILFCYFLGNDVLCEVGPKDENVAAIVLNE